MTNISRSLFPEKNIAPLFGFQSLRAQNAVCDFLFGNSRASRELVSTMGFKLPYSLGHLLMDVAKHDAA